MLFTFSFLKYGTKVQKSCQAVAEWAKKFNFASLTASLQNYLTCLKHYFSLLILPVSDHSAWIHARPDTDQRSFARCIGSYFHRPVIRSFWGYHTQGIREYGVGVIHLYHWYPSGPRIFRLLPFQRQDTHYPDVINCRFGMLDRNLIQVYLGYRYPEYRRSDRRGIDEYARFGGSDRLHAIIRSIHRLWHRLSVRRNRRDPFDKLLPKMLRKD